MEPVIRLAQELGVVVLLGPVFDFCGNELLHKDGIKELRRLAKFDNVCVNWAFLEFYLDGGNQIKKAALPGSFIASIVISPTTIYSCRAITCMMKGLKITHEKWQIKSWTSCGAAHPCS